MQELQRRSNETALEPAECISEVPLKVHAEANAVQPSGLKEVGTLDRGAVQEGVEVVPESSAARAFAQRKGFGRQKHVHVRWLWVQDKVLSKEATVEAANTAYNVAKCLDESSGEHNDESPLK
eukprot:4476309-Amphidinium_carterae.2